MGYSMNDDELTTIQLEKISSQRTKKHPKTPQRNIQRDNSGFDKKQPKTPKKRRQYDEFLHTIQQAKMKELWDNVEDEAWENA